MKALVVGRKAALREPFLEEIVQFAEKNGIPVIDEEGKSYKYVNPYRS